MGEKEELEELLEMYVEAYRMECRLYGTMGSLLDKKFVSNQVKSNQLGECFIYGGGFLGIQLYEALKEFVPNVMIVDREGKLVIERNEIPVVSFEELKKIYNGQKIIISLPRLYREIIKDLSEFVSRENILCIEEFMEVII